MPGYASTLTRKGSDTSQNSKPIIAKLVSLEDQENLVILA